MATNVFIGTHKGVEKTIELEAKGNGLYTVQIDGVAHEVDARRFGGGNWSVIIDHQSYDVELEISGQNESEGHYASLVRGQLVKLRVQDERRVRMQLSSKKATLDGPQTLSSPMPGKVVKILAGVGAEVTEGHPIVIIEAMKMENELRAPKSGKVSAVMVKEGQTVDNHAKLVTIE
ncbi:acetyl-CoA carboxylase biotin carboxyl carrier protein subunit [Myxococcota bacterium]|nr:acetyl-CoA carboxylase biotin carboxyl carrier protein subunit [Myxococcota bacterium]